MLGILATHPIQYQVPAWILLAERGRVPFEVLYLTAQGAEPSLDPGFGRSFQWDLDLLSHHPYRFPANPPPAQLGGFWEMGLPSPFRARIKDGRYKAFVVPGWHVRACWEAVWLSHRHGVRVWMRGDSHDLKAEGMVRRIAKQLAIGSLFRRVDRFMNVGEATRRLFLRYGAEPSALVRAPHAVDNGRFAAQASIARVRRAEVRRAWGIPEDAYCVLFAGKLDENKRPFDLVAALARLGALDRSRSYHLLVVGSGNLGTRLRESCNVVHDASEGPERTEMNPDSPRASFTGFLNQSEMPRAFVAADLLVLPSAAETWGLVVNEALACGLPCVVSDACGAAEELVTPLDPALCYPAGDVEALARAIRHAAESPPSSQAMSALIGKFDLVANVEAIERLWDELSAGSSSR